MTEITPWGDDSADLYELVFGRDDHDAQVAYVHQIVRREAPDAASLLDVACGTGWHLERLGRWFEVEGLDGSRGMLAHARARLPGTPLHLADMRSLELDRTFDVITCLSSSIAWMQTREDLAEALSAMARHLSGDGLLLVEPWPAPGADPEMETSWATIVRHEDRTIALVETTRLEEGRWIQDTHYLIADEHGIRHVSETTELGAFTREDMTAGFRQAGLSVVFDDRGPLDRGLYIARLV